MWTCTLRYLVKKNVLIFVFSLIFCIATLNATEPNINDKIDSLLQNRVIEITGAELKSFKNKSFEQKLISHLKKIDPTNKTANALSDYIEIGNYEILNAIKLNNNNIFLNYLVRSNESIFPKKAESRETLGHDKIKHHVILLYNINKKEITEINYMFVQYTPILFHKYEYNGKNILYGIGNNSSSGMAITDIYFLAILTKNLELLFSECILFSQSFYSNEIEDIEFEKDFVFNEDKIEITGKDFDFKKQKYVDYTKIYKLF